MKHSQFLEKVWSSVKETRAAIMKSGCIWTLPVTGTLTDYGETMTIADFSKKDPALTHLTGKRASMMAEVTIFTLLSAVNMRPHASVS